MTFSYLSSGPGSSDRSWVRLRIGDNSSSNYRLEDEEIDVLLDDYGDKYSAGAAAARSMGADFSRQTTKTVGKLKIAMAEASQHYFDLAEQLDKESQVHAGGGFAGGISISDKETQTDDTDWQGSFFERGQFDNVSSSPTQRNS